MPTMENNWFRRLVFITVYLVQGMLVWLTLSYFPILFENVYLIDKGLYGIAGSIALLPMVFKFFIGPLSDKFPIPFLRGRNRGYIIVGAVLNVVFLPLLSLDPRVFFVLFFIVWFMQTLGVAIMDILTDALAISAKSIQNIPGRTGASAWMFLGSFLGGGIVIAFVPLLDADLFLGVLLIAIISLLPLLVIFFLKEQPSTGPAEKRNVREVFRRNLKHPFVRLGLVFAFLLSIDTGLLELTLEPFLDRFPGSPGRKDLLGQLFGLTFLGIILGLLFALSIKRLKFLKTPLIDRVKKPRILIVIAVIYAIPSPILGILIFNDMITYYSFLAFYSIFAVVSTLSYITYIGLFLDLSDPKAAGTMIAAFFSINNLGIAIGIAIGGFIPFWLIYIIVAILSAMRIIPLLKIRMEDVQKTFYQETSQ
ncbi:MAG: MFS transporter [Candidatus Helarchaeota archaeon]|nr:MFS transporter [Candidatus Helarchaeota archaeon]